MGTVVPECEPPNWFVIPIFFKFQTTKFEVYVHMLMLLIHCKLPILFHGTLAQNFFPSRLHKIWITCRPE